MELEKNKQGKMFEIRPSTPQQKAKGGVFPKGRILLGRSESCDLIVNYDAVSAVHAVMEIFEDRAVIYDMNSTNGTYVNDDKVIVKEVRVGDHFRLADIEFTYQVYNPADALPPVLETLEPAHGEASVKLPPTLDALPAIPKALPKAAPAVSQQMPSIVYPLASDPKAEFSEYIFEDKEDLYPIFKYESAKQAVEVIILFKDQVFSVDYLPEGKGTYFISGVTDKDAEIEFPYLQRNEKYPFVDVRGSSATVNTLPGFGVFLLSDNKKDTGHVGTSIDLTGQDLLRLQKNDLQIFVRNVVAPPKILAAPILKRDPEFRKYLALFLFLVALFMVTTTVIEVPKDEKKDDLAPERLATILYKAPLTVSKNIAIEKTENAPKVVQKSPNAVPTEKKPEQPKVVKKPEPKQPDPGKKTATEKKIVKQGTKPVTKPSNQKFDTPQAKADKNLTAKQAPAAFSNLNIKTQGHVEVYKSADFASTVSTMVAKGGSLTGVQTKGASGSGPDPVGGISGVASGTGSVKTSNMVTNQGSLVGATTGVLGESKGAEGLSAKSTIYTAGIPGETVVLGSMDPDVIRRILMEHLPQFRYCYQQEIERRGAEVFGIVKLNFVIGASGHVSRAGVDGGSNLPVEVNKCVVNVLRGIVFPEPMGGGTVEVKQPMNFQTKKI